MSCLLNVKNSYVTEGKNIEMDNIFTKAALEKTEKDQTVDAGVQQGEHESNFAVFNSEQIHILGSEFDVEKFKEFIKTNQNL